MAGIKTRESKGSYFGGMHGGDGNVERKINGIWWEGRRREGRWDLGSDISGSGRHRSIVRGGVLPQPTLACTVYTAL